MISLIPTFLFFETSSKKPVVQIKLSPMSLIKSKQLNHDIQKILPQWKKQFEKFGKKYNVPWALVAAVAYQESKWNNDAVSFTGVKGLMQITASTAEHIGITDREDALQSIQGGSYYLRYLFEKTPQHISTSDRWIQALAGYNIGWAHLRDIHRLARHQKLNAYKWENLKKLLPLKAEENYRDQFNFGLARGRETVHFIENVVTFYQFLSLHFPEKTNSFHKIASK